MNLFKLLVKTIFFIVFPLLLFSQDTADSLSINSESLDFYDRYNDVLGGDSIRFSKNKPCQGWIKDYYPDRKLKHNGLYEKGKLSAYKNYFVNGKLERSFVKKDTKKSQLETYYYNGEKHTEAVFYFNTPVKWIDYYPDGSIESIEEYNNGLDYYIQHKFYYKDGKPHIMLELIDKKTKTYNYKEYYITGQISEEGQKIYNKSSGDYPRIGTWKIYDESSKLVRIEIYNKGVLIEEKLYE
ncbi:hypothetical protein ACFL6I_12895 [candidate division KSB1 bacterium]